MGIIVIKIILYLLAQFQFRTLEFLGGQCLLLLDGGWREIGRVEIEWGSRKNLHSLVPHSIPCHLMTFTLMKKSLEELYM
uniref:Uncharacterized protein n=1 Tax=Ursus maritimus TaxID=29073 RepID=A0A452T2L7_URSMA